MNKLLSTRMRAVMKGPRLFSKVWAYLKAAKFHVSNNDGEQIGIDDTFSDAAGFRRTKGDIIGEKALTKIASLRAGLGYSEVNVFSGVCST